MFLLFAMLKILSKKRLSSWLFEITIPILTPIHYGYRFKSYKYNKSYMVAKYSVKWNNKYYKD